MGDPSFVPVCVGVTEAACTGLHADWSGEWERGRRSLETWSLRALLALNGRQGSYDLFCVWYGFPQGCGCMWPGELSELSV